MQLRIENSEKKAIEKKKKKTWIKAYLIFPQTINKNKSKLFIPNAFSR